MSFCEKNAQNIWWISSKSTTFAPQFKTGALVQLVRMPACHAGGRWFESCTHRLNSSEQSGELLFLLLCSIALRKGVAQPPSSFEYKRNFLLTI